MQVAHLVVGQAIGLVIAVILMHLVAIQTVQAAIGGNPYISVGVLYDGADALVGEVRRDLHALGIGLDNHLRCPMTSHQKHKKKGKKTKTFHGEKICFTGCKFSLFWMKKQEKRGILYKI